MTSAPPERQGASPTVHCSGWDRRASGCSSPRSGPSRPRSGRSTSPTSGRPPRAAISIRWWALAIAFYLAETFVVHLHFRKQAHTLSPSEVGLVLGLFFATPAALLAAQVPAPGWPSPCTAARGRSSSRSTSRSCRSAPASRCSSSARFAVAGTRNAPTWGVALLAAAAAHAAGVLLVSAVIAVAEGRFSAPQLPRTLAMSLVGVMATACLGLAGVVLIARPPTAALLLVVPVVACALAFRGYMRQREHREHLEFLYESMRATQGAPEFGLAVGQLLVAARRLLRADYAEILLFSPTPGEPALRSVSGPCGRDAHAPGDADAGGRLALERTAAAQRPLLLPRRRGAHPLDQFLAARGLDDAVVGALRGEQRVLGLLVVGGRVSDVSTFAETETSPCSRRSGATPRPARERTARTVAGTGDRAQGGAASPGATTTPSPACRTVLFSELVTEALAGQSEGGTKPRGPLPRPRPLQARERQLGPRGRRRAAHPGGRAHPRPRSGRATRRPARRRRVRDPAPEHRRRGGATPRGASPSALDHAVLARGTRGERPREHRHRGDGARGGDGRGAAPQRRHRHVHGEETSTRRRSTSRACTTGSAAPRARARGGARDRERRVHRPLPAGRVPGRRHDPGLRGPGPVAAPGARPARCRASSSASPRRTA